MMALLSQVPQQQQPDLSIPTFFAKLRDPRRAHRRLHRLQDILVIALCAVIAGAQDWQQIVTFGRKRLEWLRGFLERICLARPHTVAFVLPELLSVCGLL
jgi:DDE_Tnp_1-associated